MTADILVAGLTRSGEDYLKAIYRLSADGGHASTGDIAARLGLSAPSVSGMVKRLNEQGLVTHEPYHGVVLTAEGRRVALRMVRRHRVIETYLVQTLGYSWDAVHDEAERLEHAASDDLIDRMCAQLGNPTTDPHGDPIPGPDGTIEAVTYRPLVAIGVGETVAIARVADVDAERLRYLASLGLTPGARVTVIDRQPFQGPISVQTADRAQVVGAELASVLLCVESPASP
jgi:DtxR family Mn-dependent transcriptional regulator